MVDDPVGDGRIKVAVHGLEFSGLLTVRSHARNRSVFYCFRGVNSDEVLASMNNVEEGFTAGQDSRELCPGFLATFHFDCGSVVYGPVVRSGSF